MPISKSSFVLGTPRADGLVPCTETVTTEYGDAIRAYAAAPDSDWPGHLAETVAHIKALLAEREYALAEATDGPLALKNQTLLQFLGRFRAQYRAAGRTEAAAMADWLVRRITAGHISEASIKSAFGLTTDAKLASFKARINQQAAAWGAFLVALGED